MFRVGQQVRVIAETPYNHLLNIGDVFTIGRIEGGTIITTYGGWHISMDDVELA